MPADVESNSPAGVRYVFTLVHGTRIALPLCPGWAKPRWVRPESAMSKALVERFGDDRTKVFPGNWSGGNSLTARREGSVKLRNQLGRQLTDYDGARHYLVCHSHGGNVALRALAASGLQDKIAGVVCLATPFLVARKRDLGRNPWELLSGGIALVFLLTVLMVMEVLKAASWPFLGLWLVSSLIGIVVAGALVILALTREDYAEELRLDLASPALDPDRILIIRSPGDEASGALAFSQFISQLSVWLFVGSQRLYERAEAVANGWAKQEGKMLVVMVAAAMTADFLEANPQWEAGVAAFLSALVGLEAFFLFLGQVGYVTAPFLMAASAVVWPVIALLSILLLPFGWETAKANIFWM